jgi:WD40 repeat protein/DNA-binding SARP family transcriptional activator
VVEQGLPGAKVEEYGHAMLFRVLGPIDVAVDDQPIALGGPKQRSVLAILLARPNQVVPADDLIDQIWGEDPPKTARKTLQSYVTHLRKALGPDRVQWRAPGYIVRVGPRELDAARFEALVREAKAAASRPDRAASLYRRALEQWRGPAFADLAGNGALAAEAHRLDELRLGAVEGRIAADLDASRHDELIPELTALTSEHPLRESIWGQLMVALYRSGRQADASAAYHRAREVLAEELGMDPSEELRGLHDRILRNDPALEAPHERLRGYELVEEIGEGAFGVVHRAWQPQLARDVAIKAIRPALANDPEFIRRFEAEAQVVARLEHPNIVPLYDFWREPGAAYLVMRWIRGGSLDEISRRSPFDLDTVARLEEQIVGGVSFAHRLGVVHSDLKPANVLLDEEGNAYLSDFGIAADLRGLRAEERDLRLSPAYLAPEQIRGEPATPATDIYCLGLLLYQVLCGTHAFPGTPPVTLMQKQLHEPLPPVTERRHELPSAIDDVIGRATAKDPGARFADVAAFDLAFREALQPARAKSALGARMDVANPYKGLRSFGEADMIDFFGRNALVERLVARWSEAVEGNRFLGVVGPSGSGKSSAVRAGLVPALRGGAVPGSDTWFVVEMMPGAHPFEELEASLLRIATDPPPTLADELRADHGFVNAIERVLPPDGSELFLVIDQLEEVFTHVDDEATRARFLACLASAATDPRSRTRLLVTLRADYFDRPLAYPGFGPLLGSRTETVTPLTPAELELAIAGPAERIGVSVEPELLAEIVADSTGRLGTLPLLQYALTELFERREDAALTLSGYRHVGGIGGALAGRAERLYEATGRDEGKDANRQLFLRLVNVDEGVEDLRRRVRRSELLSIEGDSEAMASAIDAFTRHRLLTSDRDPVTREPTVEVAHEALLRSWPRLRGWIDSAREDLQNHRHLATEAVQWEEADRDPSFLLRASRLKRFEAWVADSGFALNSAEREYLEASLRQREAERTAEEAQSQRQRLLERRSVRRLRALVAVLASAAIVATGLTAIATTQREKAAREARTASARELAAAAVANLDVDPERSILLALQAVDRTRSADGFVLPEAEEALHRAVTASRIVRTLPVGATNALDWGSTGVFVAAGTENRGMINVKDPATGETVVAFQGPAARITDLAFSPDGSMLATASVDGLIVVWGVSNGNLVASMSGEGAASGLSFSADGSLLAGAWPDGGTVKVMDVSDSSVIRTLGRLSGATHTAFDPHGGRIAVATQAFDCNGERWKVLMIDLETEGRTVLRGSQPCGANFVAWSPDGRYIAANADTANVKIWDSGAGELRFTLFGHSDEVFSGDWSSDSTRLVTGSYDGTARVWKITAGGTEQLLVLSAHGAHAVWSVAFSPDDAYVMTTDDTSTARIWDVSAKGGAEVGILPAPIPGWGFDDIAFLDRRRAVLPSGSGKLAVWDVEAGLEVGTIGPRLVSEKYWPSPPGFDVSRDGSTIAIARGDQTVSLWDTATGDEVFSFEEPLMQQFDISASGEYLAILAGRWATAEIVDRSGRVRTTGVSERMPYTWGAARVQLSPDDRLVALATPRTVAILDWNQGAVVATIPAQTDWLAFDPSGTLIATAGDDRTAEIWDVRSGELVTTLPAQSGDIYGLSFSPDGSLLAVGSGDGTVRLFDRRSDRLVTLPGNGVHVIGISFSPDGSMLAELTFDGMARIWAIDIDLLLHIAREKVTRSLTEEECGVYLHVVACPSSIA